MSGDNVGNNLEDTPGETIGASAAAKPRKRSGAAHERQTAVSESSPSRPQRPRPAKGAKPDTNPDATLPAVADLLRAVATSIERDPALARSLLGGEMEPATLNRDARLQGANSTLAEKAPPTTLSAKHATRSAHSPEPTLDPFAVLREHGEHGLRTQLGALRLEGLRAIVRAHRLDPARIASRWTDHERLIALIVEQVRARAGLGRAFERV